VCSSNITLTFLQKGQKKRWVWEYAKRKRDKAYWKLCDKDENNDYSCVDGTTGSLIKHLKIMHKARYINIQEVCSLENCKYTSMPIICKVVKHGGIQST